MKIIVCGCNGKMGKTVISLASGFTDCEIVGGIDLSSVQNDRFSVFESPEKINAELDVIIDFSNPASLENLLDYSVKNCVPLVICTTGFSEAQVKDIKHASKFTPIFYSRNMSLGVNLLLELSRKAAKVLGNDFDIEIIEKHHSQKIDAPSGTALMIAEEISSCTANNFDYTYDRSQQRKSRSKNEIGIHSVRGGNIFGDHDVIFAGNNETITLSHHCGSRDVFAAGAIKAARFIFKKEPGFYTMKDLI